MTDVNQVTLTLQLNHQKLKCVRLFSSFCLDPGLHTSSCNIIFLSEATCITSILRYLNLGLHSLLQLAGGGGRSGPVPFADISGGRLICPLPLNGKAAVMAAQLSLNKKEKMHKQTGAIQIISAVWVCVCVASYGCINVQVQRLGEENCGVRCGSLMAKNKFT